MLTEPELFEFFLIEQERNKLHLNCIMPPNSKIEEAMSINYNSRGSMISNSPSVVQLDIAKSVCMPNITTQ